MRWSALALLVAASGCNWVFGLEQTRLADAPGDVPDAPPDAPPLTIVFERQVATTDPSGAPISAPPIAISPAPNLALGPLGQPTQPASYDASTRSFAVPFNLQSVPWRLVYTVDGDPVPYEIQWNLTSAHLTLPWLARPGDAPPPPGSGYTITPTPTTVMYTPQLMTSGAFTFTPVSPSDYLNGGRGVAFPYATEAAPILGTVGTPKVANGDWVLLFDHRLIDTPNPTTYAATGYAWMQLDLTAGAQTAATPAWNATVTTHSGINYATIANEMRMNTVGSLGGTCCSYHLEYGILPSPSIAPFRLTPTGIDTTIMVDLFTYDDQGSDPISFMVADPPVSQVPLPRVHLGAMSRPRTNTGLGGVTVATTFQTLTTDKSFTFAGPLATAVTFAGVTLMTGSADDQQVPGSTGLMELDWAPESGNINISVDDYVVTLYELAGGNMVPMRRYQVTAPKVKIDGALLVTGHRYIFSITSRKGFPQASTGDYSVVQLPFSETTTFPLAFVINQL